LGRTRALVSLLGIYIAFVFDSTFIYFKEISNLIKFVNETFYVRVALFIIVYILVFIILNRSLLKARLNMKEVSIITVFIITILQLGLLISILANMIPVGSFSIVPALFIKFFATKTALFYWVVLPILIMIFLKNNKKKSSSISA